MNLKDTIFDTADGLECFTRCLSRAIKCVKGSIVITADPSAYKVDNIPQGSYEHYGRFLDQSGEYWVGLDMKKENPKLIFLINKPTQKQTNLAGDLPLVHTHIANSEKPTQSKPIKLELIDHEFDNLADPLTADDQRAKIIKDFLEEVKSITG